MPCQTEAMRLAQLTVNSQKWATRQRMGPALRWTKQRSG